MAGQIYVPVSGKSVDNGIMPMASSGGSTGGSYWLVWTNDGGFTGTGWDVAWNSANVPLQNAWTKSPANGYTNDLDGFKKYVSNPSITELNKWLDEAGWSSEEKYDFAHENLTIWNYCIRPA